MLYETLPDDMGCLYTYMHTEIVVQHICDEVVRVSFLGFLSTLCSTTCVPFYVHPKKSAGKSIRIYSPENQHVPWKSMVGRCIPYWNGPFSGDMLVFWGVEYRTSKTWQWTRSPNLLWSTWIVPSDLQRKQLVCRRCSAFFQIRKLLQFWCQRNKPWCSNQQQKIQYTLWWHFRLKQCYFGHHFMFPTIS